LSASISFAEHSVTLKEFLYETHSYFASFLDKHSSLQTPPPNLWEYCLENKTTREFEKILCPDGHEDKGGSETVHYLSGRMFFQESEIKQCPPTQIGTFFKKESYNIVLEHSEPHA
jgi:hypothetical protein